MTLKEKTKTYSFWISLASSLLLVAKTIAEQLGYTISDGVTTNIITGVCGAMVLVGLFLSPTKRKSLKELTAEAEQIMKDQEQTIEEFKKEAIEIMETEEKLSIEKQIEYLKAKLAEAEQTQEPVAQEAEPVQESAVQEAEQVQEPAEEVAEVQEEPKEEVSAEPVVVEESSEIQKEQPADYQELGLAELKELIKELLSRI